MATDRYTKTVLTVIALCLLYLCLGRPGIAPVASAQTPTSGYSRVVVYGWLDEHGKEWRLPPTSPKSTNAAPLPVSQ